MSISGQWQPACRGTVAVDEYPVLEHGQRTKHRHADWAAKSCAAQNEPAAQRSLGCDEGSDFITQIDLRSMKPPFGISFALPSVLVTPLQSMTANHGNPSNASAASRHDSLLLVHSRAPATLTSDDTEPLRALQNPAVPLGSASRSAKQRASLHPRRQVDRPRPSPCRAPTRQFPNFSRWAASNALPIWSVMAPDTAARSAACAFCAGAIRRLLA